MKNQNLDANKHAHELCDLIHLSYDILERETHICAAKKSRIELGLSMALIAAMNWRDESPDNSDEPLPEVEFLNNGLYVAYRSEQN